MSKTDNFQIAENVSLAPMTTLGIGGPARFFAECSSEQDLARAFTFAGERGLGVFVLGGGSNVLISDAGFDGLVIRVSIRGVEFADGDITRQRVTVSAGAGEDWDSLVRVCVERDLAGFECLSGIPGFVGGTPVQNVGAYGQEVSESIISVRCYDRLSHSIVELDNAACAFSYRKSIFNTTEAGRYVVLRVTYGQIMNGEPRISYKDVREIFSAGRATVKEVRRAVLMIRARKSMVIDVNDPNSRSAGSFFKNPIIDIDAFESLRRDSLADNVPSFAYGDGKVKVPAAWLIESAGFHKGYRMGRAGISSNHSLALVNCGGATAAEIIALKDAIQTAVQERFAIRLEPEPVFVGF